MTVAVRMGRSDASRIAPAEYRDAVELFARQYGGHGDVIWIPNPGNVWQARLELAPNDPRRKAQAALVRTRTHVGLPLQGTGNALAASPGKRRGNRLRVVKAENAVGTGNRK